MLYLVLWLYLTDMSPGHDVVEASMLPEAPAARIDRASTSNTVRSSLMPCQALQGSCDEVSSRAMVSSRSSQFSNHSGSSIISALSFSSTALRNVGAWAEATCTETDMNPFLRTSSTLFETVSDVSSAMGKYSYVCGSGTQLTNEA